MLDHVGVDLDPPVLEEAFQALPVVEAVVDSSDRRFGGSACELRLQLRLQIGNPLLAFRLAHRPTLLGTPATDLCLVLYSSAIRRSPSSAIGAEPALAIS
jgi:hypothetical protein